MIADHAATPAALCDGSGVPFSCPALVISRWLAPEVAVFNGLFPVRTSRPPAGDRSMRLPPDSPDPTPPDPSVPPPYDAEFFADLLIDDPDRALRVLAAMSELERAAQAIAYATWLHGFGLPVAVEDVLANWAARIAAKEAS
jgi:hypothetical protein